MRGFEQDLSRFLTKYGLPPLAENRPDGWPRFLHLYTRVIEDIPLVVSLPVEKKKNKKTGKQRITASAPKHISHVVVHFEPARETVQRGGEEEMFFKVTWTIHDKNGQSGDIFVLNSFSLQH